MDPVVKELTCPACGKATNVRVIPSSPTHTYNCPHCKTIQTAKG